jgi:hypothetical protein
MENIPDPKYKIGDLVIVSKHLENDHKTFQMVITRAYLEAIWKYCDEHNSWICEDQIIKKLN